MQGSPTAQSIGNYRLYGAIGSGGMGTVFLGRLFARGGFRRIVAIKQLHPHLAQNAEFVSAFLDEARLASRIHHPNVVAPLDVVAENGEVVLVFAFVMGVQLAALSRAANERAEAIPPRIATKLMIDVLAGLHAAHEALGDGGEPLGLIHRDVSPQNVLVGRDGTAYLLDFGIAKAAGRAQTTDEGIVKGKRGYMAPEHLVGLSRRESDLYSAGVVLWELLASRRLFPTDESLGARIIKTKVSLPDAGIGQPHRGVLERVLDPDPAQRFATAREMSAALEAAGVATAREVAEWVERVAADDLAELAARVAKAEAITDGAPPPGATGQTPEPASDPVNEPARGPAAAVTAVELGAPRGGAHARIVTGKRAAIGAAFFLALGSCGALAAVGLRHRAPPPSTEAPAKATASDDPAQPEATPSAVAATPVEISAPIASARPEAPAHARAKSPRPSVGTRGGKAAACKPYVLDKNGRTQFNEECLRRGD